MPRAVPQDLADRRRRRLADLITALGDVLGHHVTQREFSAHIGREQGTIAAILGGHRALGGDVLNAILAVWKLPADAFDVEATPDFRTLLRCSQRDATPAAGASPTRRPRVDAPRGSASAGLHVAVRPHLPTALAEVLQCLQPDRPVDMALRWLALRGGAEDADGWAFRAIAAQEAHDRGALGAWLDDALATAAVAAPAAGIDARVAEVQRRAVSLQTRSPRSSGTHRA